MVIYLVTNLVNSKKYIGQDSKDDPRYLGSGYLLAKALKKYGEANFKKDILDRCKTKEELNNLEKYWISHYNAVADPMFYNLANGGQGGFVSVASNEKRSASLIGHVHSAETKEKIRNKAIGRKPSAETKVAMSTTHKSQEKPWLNRFRVGGHGNPRAYDVYQYSMAMVLIKKWTCQKVASQELSINKSCINACIKGRQKSAGGYIWKSTRP